MKRTLTVVAVLCLSVITLSAVLVARAETGKRSTSFFNLVSKDFFAGLNGDRASMDRAMKTCEDALAKDPKNAQAMAWQGSGWVFTSSYEFQAGRIEEGKAQYIRGMARLDEALTLAPDDPMVLITHGMTWLKSGEYERDPQRAKSLTEKGVQDLESALQIIGDKFSYSSADARGMVLSTLAAGLDRLGRTADAQAVYERIVKELPNTQYATDAQGHLQK